MQKPYLLTIPATAKEQIWCISFSAHPANTIKLHKFMPIQPTTNHYTSFHQIQQSKSSSKTNTRFHQRPAIKVQNKPISHPLTCKLISYLWISKVQFQFSDPLFTSQDTSLHYYLFWFRIHKYCEQVHLLLSCSCFDFLLHIELVYLHNHNSN